MTARGQGRPGSGPSRCAGRSCRGRGATPTPDLAPADHRDEKGVGQSGRPGKAAGHNGVRSRHTIAPGRAPVGETAGHVGVRCRHTIDRPSEKPQVTMVCPLVTPLVGVANRHTAVCCVVTPDPTLPHPEIGQICRETAGHNGVSCRHTIDLMVCCVVTPLRTQKNSMGNSSLTGSAPSARTGCPTGSPSESTLDTPSARPTRSSLIKTPAWEPKPHQRAKDGGGAHGSLRTSSGALRGHDRPQDPFEGPERLLRPPAAFWNDLDVQGRPVGWRTG